jgi:hypothetical protein
VGPTEARSLKNCFDRLGERAVATNGGHRPETGRHPFRPFRVQGRSLPIAVESVELDKGGRGRCHSQLSATRPNPIAPWRTQKLDKAVFEELARRAPSGFRYGAMRLGDEAGFMHILETIEGSNPLLGIQAFNEFQSSIGERLETGAEAVHATLIGAYPRLPRVEPSGLEFDSDDAGSRQFRRIRKRKHKEERWEVR